MNTAFRDGFQSVYGARVFTDDFLPAVKAAAAAGIRYFEAGGGARFQSLYFYSNEDAFEMMDRFRDAAGPDAELQTLARGINVVGLESQPRDIIKLHATLFARHGITAIRNFDALNDVDNLIYSGKCIVEAGLRHQVAVTMMGLPPGCEGAHDADFYEMILKKILAAGIEFDSICFKDASGTSTPSTIFETVKRAKKILPCGIPLHFHTHETAGISIAGYKAAIEAGADIIDLSMAPCSGGTCQPDIATMWHALRGTDYTLDIDIDKVLKAEEVFKECMKDYFMPPEAKAVEPLIPWSPMPGGALTANTQMMRDNDIMDRFPEVVLALREVVRLGGFGTSVTPVSQFYFQQAYNNVILGEWKNIAEGYGKMILGYFGKTPIPPDPHIVEIAAKQLGLEPITRNPLDIVEEDPARGIAPATKKLEENGLPATDENIFITATCGDKGITYLLGNASTGVRKNSPQASQAETTSESGRYTVSVGKNRYAVRLDGDKAIVNGREYDYRIDDGFDDIEETPVAESRIKIAVTARMPGTIVRILVKDGMEVKTGAALLVQEAMKMETAISAPSDGTVTDIAVLIGDHVKTGQILLYIY